MPVVFNTDFFKKNLIILQYWKTQKYLSFYLVEFTFRLGDSFSRWLILFLIHNLFPHSVVD